MQRAGRRRSGKPVLAVVGYTNAGKSSLLQALTRKDTGVEDRYRYFACCSPISMLLCIQGTGLHLTLHRAFVTLAFVYMFARNAVSKITSRKSHVCARALCQVCSTLPNSFAFQHCPWTQCQQNNTLSAVSLASQSTYYCLWLSPASIPDVYACRLFATLDPALRRVHLPSGREAILSDTVGFISDLPHQLVNAFKVRKLCPQTSMVPTNGKLCSQSVTCATTCGTNVFCMVVAAF